MVTKPTKEFTDALGRRKIKGDMDIAGHRHARNGATFRPRHLFSGDGDFRRLVEVAAKGGQSQCR